MHVDLNDASSGPSYRKQFLRVLSVTPKFYSIHELNYLKGDTSQEFITNLVKLLHVRLKDRVDWPQTENQRYGWFNEPLVAMDRKDKRFYRPMKAQDVSKNLYHKSKFK